MGCPTAQRWVSCYYSDKVHHIFYHGPLGWSLLFGAPEGHSPYEGSYHIQIGGPSQLVLMMWLVHIVTTPGAIITPTASGSGDAAWTSSSDWLLKHAITPRKLGVGVAHWKTSNSCVGEGVSRGVAITSWLQNFSPVLPDGQGICLAATTGQDWCNTFSQPGNSSPQLVP